MLKTLHHPKSTWKFNPPPHHPNNSHSSYPYSAHKAIVECVKFLRLTSYRDDDDGNGRE
jgi:hypothetical protein